MLCLEPCCSKSGPSSIRWVLRDTESQSPPRCSESKRAPEQDLQVTCEHVKPERYGSGATPLALSFRDQCPSLHCLLMVSHRIRTETESVGKLLKSSDNCSDTQPPGRWTTRCPSLTLQTWHEPSTQHAQQGSEAPGGLAKVQPAEPIPRLSESLVWGRGLGICISNTLPEDADAASPGVAS